MKEKRKIRVEKVVTVFSLNSETCEWGIREEEEKNTDNAMNENVCVSVKIDNFISFFIHERILYIGEWYFSGPALHYGPPWTRIWSHLIWLNKMISFLDLVLFWDIFVCNFFSIASRRILNIERENAIFAKMKLLCWCLIYSGFCCLIYSGFELRKKNILDVY
jgi:hypothetical protein